MPDQHKQMQINHAAGNLARDARSLCAIIGASDPNDFTGWRDQIARAKADIAEIEWRAEVRADKQMEAAE